MAWKGFLVESKSYMNYPNCGHLHFWWRFPKALFTYLFVVYVRPKFR